MEMIKELLSTRGVQLLARYTGMGFALLAGKAGIEFDANAVTNASSGLAMIVVALVCFGIDHFSHKKQVEVK